ncbi:hypothetical protein [uncultured Dokdonia sp.]|uniref:hypothetical protein n=1 Tax=uncultured Dokdonia sp. TaxID=575653 RepID=UPI0026195D7B|nr:hypothetical protein [uncultured Dokdonia sp.]
MKKIIFILFISLSFIQCGNDDDSIDCSTVLCKGPEFVFEFIDADTGENVLDGVFDNGVPDGFFIALGEDDITLELGLDYALSPSNQLGIFRFSEQFQILLPNVFEVTISYDFEAISNGCCQNYSYTNIAVTNATFEQVEDENRLFLRIFI